jgi:hypothetical protein
MTQAAPLHSFAKDPTEDLPYALDWSPRLPSGETLGSVVWTFPAGLEKVSQSEAGTTATVRVKGGTLGETYRVGCHVVTAPSAYELDGSIEFRLVDR